MGWTTPEVKQYIKAQLGHPKRKIELADSNFNQAIKRSVRYYSTKKPDLRKGRVTILNGGQKYDFLALNLPFGKGLTDVYPEPITSPQDVFNEFEYYRLRQPPYVDMGELLIDQIYYKEIGYLTGTHFHWEWIQFQDKEGTDQAVLLVSPIPSRTFIASYDFNFAPDRIEDVRLTDQGWVVDYALALTKEMLGRVRGKYQGVPGLKLEINTDWSELLGEGLDAQSSLKESLEEARGDWTPPLRG